MLLINFCNGVLNYLYNFKFYLLIITINFINSLNLHSQTTAILDSNFEQALIYLNIDTNGLNGNILNSDAIAITTLYIDDYNISDLTGISAFQNLKNLYAINNHLTTIDLSTNPNIEIIDFDNNYISTINLQANTQLKKLYISNNLLTTLDVSNNSNLELLSCNINNLSALDLSFNINLKDLRCYDNNISNLDVSNNLELEFLYASSNNLSHLQLNLNTDLKSLSFDNNSINSIDLSQNEDLTYLSCSNNNLTNLDISNNDELKRILCNNNNLTVLDLSQTDDLFLLYAQNNNIENLDLSNNPNLKYFRAENNALSLVDIRTSTNYKLNEFVVTDNDDLTCIYVDDKYASYLNDWEVGSSCNFVLDEAECQTLSITETVLETFSLYPNPASSSVTIHLTSADSNLKIYSLKGQIVYESILRKGENQVNTSHLSAGVYVVSILTENSNITKKLVIQ
ncbi:putative secreted protein (Por secretion system target) [Oceanihabitans sediminis]|uniref:T9SS C-terminal target domain-containing protein n=1 Tax=Oceanihabitans sediminis TaxID=1812012 RepID=A0A368P4L7_9FLAO|nr:T9SS type A sorting domain-containing protein [Oceanihabitans sediminis]RBP33086.1 putative secreted protein (Por secretion system target) [Oceanihabitans sediminis]RCU57403.1 T9SS C-terminal target domain-containing protein [Oceanihabitans sediminis]